MDTALPSVKHFIKSAYFKLMVIIALSFFVRLAHITLRYIPSGDESSYIGVAKNVYEGKGYVEEILNIDHPTGLRKANDIPPLYTLSVVALHKLSGYRPANARYVNLFFSTLLILAVFFAVRKMANGTAALIAALFVGLDPTLTFYTAKALKDLAFTCCASLLFLALQTSRRSRAYYPAVIGSLVAVILARRNGYWMVPPALYMVWISHGDLPLRRRMAACLYVLLPAVLLVCPWYLSMGGAERGEWQGIATYATKTFSRDYGGNRMFVARWFAELQRGIRTLLAVSGAFSAIFLFLPFYFLFNKIRPIDRFAISALAVFLVLLSMYEWDNPVHYYLCFVPYLYIYSVCGLFGLLARLSLSRSATFALLGALLMICIFPATESLRNHLRPKLRKKYDGIGAYRSIQTVVHWLNTHTAPGERIAGCSAIRHFLYDIDSRVISLPGNGSEFNPAFFRDHHVSWLVVGSSNLRMSDNATRRLYLNAYWGLDMEGVIRETDPPAYLERAFRTDNQIVYKVLLEKMDKRQSSPAETLGNRQ